MKRLKKLLTILLLGPLFPIIGVEGEADQTPPEGEVDQTPPAEEPKQPEQPKTFTESDVNKIVEKRLNRERKSWEKKVEEDKIKAAMTVEEKLKAEKLEAEIKANEAITKANQRLIKSEIVSKAGQIGVIDIDAAYKLLNKDDIEIDEDGNITGVDEAIKDLITKKPYLLKKATTEPNNSGDDQGQSNNKKSKSTSFNDMIRKATGHLNL